MVHSVLRTASKRLYKAWDNSIHLINNLIVGGLRIEPGFAIEIFSIDFLKHEICFRVNKPVAFYTPEKTKIPTQRAVQKN